MNMLVKFNFNNSMANRFLRFWLVMAITFPPVAFANAALAQASPGQVPGTVSINRDNLPASASIAGVMASLGIMRIRSQGGRAQRMMSLNHLQDYWGPIPAEMHQIKVPRKFIKLQCNVQFNPDDAAGTVVQYLPNVHAFLDFITKNMNRCIPGYFSPDVVDPDQIKIFSGNYIMEEGRSLSGVLHTIGALPLWFSWGAMEQVVRQSSGIASKDKIRAGRRLFFKDLLAIRSCNAVFSSHGTFTLRKPPLKSCKGQPTEEPTLTETDKNITHQPSPTPQPLVLENISRSSGSIETAESLFAESKQRATVEHHCDWDGALELVRKAENADPSNAAYPIHEVRILYFAGRREDAKKTTENLIKRHPQLEFVPFLRKISMTPITELPHKKTDDQCEILTQQKSFSMPVSPSDAVPSGISQGSIAVSPSFTSSNPTLLAASNLQREYAVQPAERDLYSNKRYVLKVALQGQNQVAYLYQDHFINKDGSGFKPGFNTDLVLKDRHNCFAIHAYKPDLTEETVNLCVELSSETLAKLSLDNQAFWFRRHKGAWAQLGANYVLQSIPSISAGGPQESSSVVGIRAEAGAWWHNWVAQGFYRHSVVDLGGKHYSPSWLNLLVGRDFEMKPFSIFTPVFIPLIGIELYNNSLSSVGYQYISAYQGLNLGFESRFIVGSNLEVGGTFLYGISHLVHKYFIQADTRYWFDNQNGVGGGFWYDGASGSSVSFEESNTAIELYYRRLFDF